MSLFIQSILDPLLPLLGAAALAGATWALGRLAALLNAHTKNAYLNGVMARLDSAVLTAVQALEQTVVADLTGPVGLAQGLKLKQAAIAMAKAYVGPSGVALLSKIVGVDQLETLLSGKVEAAVLSVSNGKT